MLKILHRRTADGRVRRLLQPTPTDNVILRRRSADGRVRRILRSTAASEVAVSAVAPAAFESLARRLATMPRRSRGSRWKGVA